MVKYFFFLPTVTKMIPSKRKSTKYLSVTSIVGVRHCVVCVCAVLYTLQNTEKLHTKNTYLILQDKSLMHGHHIPDLGQEFWSWQLMGISFGVLASEFSVEKK